MSAAQPIIVASGIVNLPVHMNGRIYDPSIGRFLQADPFIDGATTTAGFNRYSYVRNNPLNATDPSGYKFFQEVFDDILGITESPVLNAVAQIASCYVAGPAGCAAYAAASAKGHGGDWGDAIMAAAIAGASAGAFDAIGSHFEALSGTAEGVTYSFGGLDLSAGQITQQIFAHSYVGGLMSVLQGGKFGHGFAAAGLTKGVMGLAGFNYSNRTSKARLGRTIFAAVLGGSISKATGGKFANGAVTAAMAHMFNAERVADLNPFKIIKTEIVDWWGSSETADLRSGLDVALDLATVPFRLLRLPVTAKDVAVAGDQYLDGDVAEAAITLGGVVIGEATVKQLQVIGVSQDMFNHSAGVVSSRVGEAMIEKDCYSCD